MAGGSPRRNRMSREPAVRFAGLPRSSPPGDALLSIGGPSAIPRFVGTVIVDTVDGQSPSGRFAHVGQEVLELPPAVADGDTSASVVPKSRRVRIGATGQHHFPAAIDPRMTHSVGRMTMATRLSTQASTTLRSPNSQSIHLYDGELPTVAPATPSTLALVVHDDQAPVAFSGSINTGWHVGNYTPHTAKSIGENRGCNY